MLDYRHWRFNRTRARTAARLRWWVAQQMLAIDCQAVGGRSPETAIPLQQLADLPERYELMLRYARCCFGRAWRLERIASEQREGRRLECLIVTMRDDRQQHLWFDVTPGVN